MVSRALIIAAALVLAPPPALAADGAPPAGPSQPRCVDDPASPRNEITAAFAELQKIHRGRVPGPSGQRIVDLRVRGLLERLVGLDLFAGLALGDAWTKAEDVQRASWRDTLRETLQRRYLKRLGSPLLAEIEFGAVELRCDKARVAFTLRDRHDKKMDVVLDLAATVTDGAVTWAAFDVSVDGVSLLETWRSRFRRIYEEGGVAAVDYHMRGLRERFGPSLDRPAPQ